MLLPALDCLPRPGTSPRLDPPEDCVLRSSISRRPGAMLDRLPCPPDAPRATRLLPRFPSAPCSSSSSSSRMIEVRAFDLPAPWCMLPPTPAMKAAGEGNDASPTSRVSLSLSLSTSTSTSARWTESLVPLATRPRSINGRVRDLPDTFVDYVRVYPGLESMRGGSDVTSGVAASRLAVTARLLLIAGLVAGLPPSLPLRPLLNTGLVDGDILLSNPSVRAGVPVPDPDPAALADVLAPRGDSCNSSPLCESISRDHDPMAAPAERTEPASSAPGTCMSAAPCNASEPLPLPGYLRMCRGRAPALPIAPPCNAPWPVSRPACELRDGWPDKADRSIEN